MIEKRSLDYIKDLHHEAYSYYEAELGMLKEAISRITDERTRNAAVLLFSCGQIGTAIMQLSTQIGYFTSALPPLYRSFMETITNFCYVTICDEDDYRAFVLHPIYKYYHNAGLPKVEDGFDFDHLPEYIKILKERQKKLKEQSIVQEALSVFSETKKNMNWTKKSLNQRIEVLRLWGKMFDNFFSLLKIETYSDSSEAIHGSLYGCTYNVGTFDPSFDNSNSDELDKKLYKDNAYNLIHMGLLINEALKVISFTSDIKDITSLSYGNLGQALNLQYVIIGNYPKLPKKVKKNACR